jgi:hypothetical protein
VKKFNWNVEFTTRDEQTGVGIGTVTAADEDTAKALVKQHVAHEKDATSFGTVWLTPRSN